MELYYDGIAAADDDDYHKTKKLDKEKLLSLTSQCFAAHGFTPLHLSVILMWLSEKMNITVQKLMPYAKEALNYGIQCGYLSLSHDKLVFLLEKHHPRLNNQNPIKQVKYM
nr:uncharacterized protein LOC106692841 [Halyomorpha halys]